MSARSCDTKFALTTMLRYVCAVCCCKLSSSSLSWIFVPGVVRALFPTVGRPSSFMRSSACRGSLSYSMPCRAHATHPLRIRIRLSARASGLRRPRMLTSKSCSTIACAASSRESALTKVASSPCTTSRAPDGCGNIQGDESPGAQPCFTRHWLYVASPFAAASLVPYIERHNSPHLPYCASSAGCCMYVGRRDSAWKDALRTSKNSHWRDGFLFVFVTARLIRSFLASGGGVAANFSSSELRLSSLATRLLLYSGMDSPPLFVSIHRVPIGCFRAICIALENVTFV